jgi:GrpB-like predicted nucleotidyltransferase (UPF0157 family)
MQAVTNRVDVLNKCNLSEVLRETAEKVLNLGFPQTAQFLARMAEGQGLVQVVVRGGMVTAVLGLPTELATEPFEVLDYDDLKTGLDKEEIAEVYRLANLPPPSDLYEAVEGLEAAFKRLEWPS